MEVRHPSPSEIIPFCVAVSSHQDGQATVQVTGEVDAETAPVLEQRLSELVDGGVREIVIDMAELTFMDTSGLSTLVKTVKLLRAGEGRLRLQAPRPNIQRTLEITGLDKVLLQG